MFSEAVGSGAYVTSLYTVLSLDSAGESPTVSAVLLVTSNPAVVELALGADLQKGGLYSVSAVGVPNAAASSVTPSPSLERFRYGLRAPKENVEPLQRDRERLLYGVDLLWNGVDYQETSTGDLERVGGTANVTKALYRAVETNTLPWDSTWGVGAREFVDSPSVTSGSLRGKLSAQIRKDPRVKSVKVTVEFDEQDRTFLHATPKLISGEPIARVSMVVPES